MEEEEEEEERSVFMVNFPLSVIPFDRTDTRIAGSRYLISGREPCAGGQGQWAMSVNRK